MNMDDLEYFLNKELLLPLKVPSNWYISKNYLYQVSCNWLNQLNDEDKFKMSEIFLYKNIFYANLKRIINNLTYSFVVDISVYPEIKEGLYTKFEYEIGLGLYEISKKNKLIFMRNCSFYNILDICEFLNIILIDIYHNLGDSISENDIFENLDVFFEKNK
ncbi:hypothetical protein KTI56_02735 [Acinetobacter pittii]|uniref:hypothetical protein n=1 Tax=Acinetobacter TaxID=469 RepID=UPI00194F9325|nr:MULTISPECIES: hypothetical protein [Acinetobacter]MCU4430754.1 hypothetical protein [Acinetobacter pittii]MCU4532519.1 hypothetical protein [Acinetobacter pittii]MDA3452536.1 hypothetical protein [Acinetobacter sp. AOR43_HL]QRQ11819.1 hypothetical protein I6J46_11480 [Acinetobacter pittii]